MEQRPPELRQLVIDLYNDGVTYREITERTGVPRPTIAYYVRSAGGELNRTRGPKPSPTTAGEKLATLEFLTQRVEQLAAENADLRKQLESAERRLKRVRSRK